MRRLVELLWLISAVISPTAWAATVGGSITTNTTWTLASSPYIVTSTVTVYNNATLTIEAGVQVRFNANTGLVIGFVDSGILNSGILIAQGTAAQPITFTSNSATPAPGQWNGITFKGIAFNVTTNASILDYCVVEYGGASSNDADLYLDSFTNPTIRHCTVRASDGAGIRLVYGNKPIIEHNTITGNAQGMLISFPTGQETIQHNALVGNTTSGLVNAGTDGVVARLNWWGHASGPSGSGSGSGSAVSGNVLFEPWLGQAASDPFRWTDALNSPDPFTPSGGLTTFFGSLPESANWQVTVKNASGAIVKTLTGTGASFAQDWPGTDTAGVALPNGTYTFQLDATSVSGATVAAPAVGSVTLHDALPIANITAPAPEQMLAAGSINILGTAAGSGLSSYKVEYSSGVSPTGWVSIALRTTPVTNGVLATWDASTLATPNAATLPTPYYTLRLTATSTTGHTATELVTVRLLALYSLSDSQGYFSPNGDGVNETTTISARASFPVNWTLTIKNSSGVVMKTFTGTGPPISQEWNGTDTSNAPAPDGVYTYQFQGTHAATGVTVTSATAQVTLDGTAPTASITSPTQGQVLLTDAPLTFTGTASDTNFSASSTLAYGAGSAPTSFRTLVSPYSTPVTNGTLYTLNPQGWSTGTYTFRLTVIDYAGNVSEVDRQVVFDHIQVSAVSVNPFLVDPYTGEQAGITYTLSRSANVTIRIYDAASKQLVRTLTASGQPAIAQTVLWDGKNASGAVAPLEAYYFTIEAVDPTNANRKGSYNNATTPLAGTTPDTTAITVSATNVDPYRNDLVRITYTLSALGRLTIQIFDANGATIRTLINQAIHTPGSQTELWDGRRDDGSLFQGSFSVFFDAPAGLPLNAIVLRRALPEFTNFRTEAYLIQPVFGEVSALTYTLTKNATVSIVITDPNGNAIRTLLSNVSQTAGARAVEWDGRTDAGRVVSVEGDYKVTLTAVEPASGLTSTRLGAIVVYK